MTKFRITKQKDGRYYAEYSNPSDLLINGIGQFGDTPFEAEINLQALLNAVNKEQLRTTVLLNCILTT